MERSALASREQNVSCTESLFLENTIMDKAFTVQERKRELNCLHTPCRIDTADDLHLFLQKMAAKEVSKFR